MLLENNHMFALNSLMAIDKHHSSTCRAHKDEFLFLSLKLSSEQ